MSVLYDVCLDGLTACEKPNTALMNPVMEAQLNFSILSLPISVQPGDSLSLLLFLSLTC